MGFRVRKSFGPKGFKINVGKKGITSASLKIAPGLTINSKRGTTIGIHGTGISYNTGGSKRKGASSGNVQKSNENNVAEMNLKIQKQKEYNRGFKEFTGGYNKKAMILIAISFILCLTPLWVLGLLLSLPLLLWFLIDTIIKIIKFNKYLKKSKSVNMTKVETHSTKPIEPIEVMEKVIITKEKIIPIVKKEIRFRVAGTTYNGIQKNIKSMVKEEKEISDPYEGLSNKDILEDYSDEDKIYEVDIFGSDEMQLIPEPENKFDPNAIKIVHEEIGDVGYVPAVDCKKVNKAIEGGYSMEWRLIGGKHKQIEYDDEKGKDVVKIITNTYGIMIILSISLPTYQ
ncbi:hypothetical protein [Clostridium estertheticum]|uniref:hypothetical protein n=1 Tax=Clostridium estertheticum TaxID=238834 RepID=UPI001C7DCFBE|nr:hypothetical protein [Clostridium estertheticum]MBX4271861.1 hypothetical protein [Clostridium estertheticum]WLC78296.1 hypothetical protein KTC98_13760 [Clostridium estertheticum]